MSQSAQHERRRHPRINNNIPLKISSGDHDFVTETLNISCSGAYCKINKYLEPMTKLQITLLLPFKSRGKSTVKKLSFYGVVIRTENILHKEGFYTAIFFNDIHPKDSKVLTEFIEKSLSAMRTTTA